MHMSREMLNNRKDRTPAGRLKTVLICLLIAAIAVLWTQTGVSFGQEKGDQASVPPDMSKTCSLSVSTSVPGTFQVWKIADMIDNGDGSVRFALRKEIAAQKVDIDLYHLNSSESEKSAVTLANLLNSLPEKTIPPAVSKTHLPASSGAQTIGSGLKPGLYLVDCRADEGTYREMNPVLVALPMIDGSAWNYNVTIDATKFSTEVKRSHFTVRKVWKDQENPKRPVSVKIRIHNKKTNKNKTVVLSAANNWSYSWDAAAKMSTADWAVTEVGVKSDYKWSVKPTNKKTYGLFTVTNTLKPNTPDDHNPKTPDKKPGKHHNWPPTGDDMKAGLSLLVLVGASGLLAAAILFRKRESN